MADRKVFLGSAPQHPELDRLLTEARNKPVTDAQLEEQRVSFVYGNAPHSSRITKDSARTASRKIRMTGD